MQTDLLAEARRQADICNACRYCEGYCSVFPALHRARALSDGDVIQLANLCHNCRGCYYACQYTEPHEFNLNVPGILSNVREASWEDFAWPHGLSKTFQRHGLMTIAATILAFALMFWASRTFVPQGGDGFYAVMSHATMLAIFVPAFLFPLVSIAVSLRRYWTATGGGELKMADIVAGFASAAKMKNLSGGHGDGCNFEDEDRFTQVRRYAHQAVMYGFLLCFAATCAGTILHYGFGATAPYGFWSIPKLFGVSGGILLTGGASWMVVLKQRSDRHLGATGAWSGEMAFVLLLGFIGLSGLLLYGLRGTSLMSPLLLLHLGAVLAFFLLTPYTKMAHGFYRLAALVAEAGKTRRARVVDGSSIE